MLTDAFSASMDGLDGPSVDRKLQTVVNRLGRGKL